MAYRMACERSELVAAVVSLAGAGFGKGSDDAPCQPTSAVSVVQIHGDSDNIILYQGGRFQPSVSSYPSAHATVADWAAFNHCGGPLSDTGQRLELSSDIGGSETRVERYTHCEQGAVELWTIEGGGHVPTLSPLFAPTVLAFFRSHPKP
jgi:polyhydroxybutyrate depolymerase